MMQPKAASDYGESESRAAWSVLIELGQILGQHRGRFVVVGGSVPAMLIRDAQPGHVGTLDIDLELDPAALSEGQYAELVESLVAHGYERNMPDLKPFQLRRWVLSESGESTAVMVDLLMPRDAKPRKNRPPLIEGLRVQGIDGGEIALRHRLAVTLEGSMPDGRPNSVEIHVASIPALLVMKGFALAQRDKFKDSYDVWFCIRNFAGGPIALAKQCTELLKDSVVRRGFENIAGKFRSKDDYGPFTVRRFLEGSSLLGSLTADQLQNDAFMQVNRWLIALGLREGDKPT